MTNLVESRTLGRSGIAVSPMGLGCWAIGGPFWGGDNGEIPLGWGAVDDNESIRAIHAGLAMGITLIDTADVYGAGHSERVLARALKGKRDSVVIATKFSNTFDETTKRTGTPNVSPDYIRQACEASLQRLETDVIDLYQFHQNGFPYQQAGEVRQALEDLVAAGKIRAYGWSTDFIDNARFFAEGQHCAAVQAQINVLDDAPEILSLCEAVNLACLNRGPLAMGLLTGKYTAGVQPSVDDVRGKNSPDWMKYFQNGEANPEFLAQLAAIREILTSGGRTLAQGALAWLWARSPKTLPIPGFRTVKQIEENAGAMAFSPLTADQMREIEAQLGR